MKPPIHSKINLITLLCLITTQALTATECIASEGKEYKLTIEIYDKEKRELLNHATASLIWANSEQISLARKEAIEIALYTSQDTVSLLVESENYKKHEQSINLERDDLNPIRVWMERSQNNAQRRANEKTQEAAPPPNPKKSPPRDTPGLPRTTKAYLNYSVTPGISGDIFKVTLSATLKQLPEISIIEGTTLQDNSSWRLNFDIEMKTEKIERDVLCSIQGILGYSAPGQMAITQETLSPETRASSNTTAACKAATDRMIMKIHNLIMQIIFQGKIK